jgi:Mrp family chromosome partitioning ATPase
VTDARAHAALIVSTVLDIPSALAVVDASIDARHRDAFEVSVSTRPGRTRLRVGALARRRGLRSCRRVLLSVARNVRTVDATASVAIAGD